MNLQKYKFKRYIILGLALVLALASGQTVMSRSKKANKIQNITAKEFQKKIKNSNGIILDVRTPQEVAGGHIKGSSFINIYDDDFERKVLLMQKDKPVFVYCRSGSRSTKAAEFMMKNGFNKVYNLTGGIGAWSEANLPLIKSKLKDDKNIKRLSVEEFQQVLKKDKLVFVEFHTLWCSPCIKMAPIVDSLEKTYKNKIKIMRVDLDRSHSVGEKYKVYGVPTFVLFNNSKERWRRRGEIDKSVLIETLDNASTL